MVDLLDDEEIQQRLNELGDWEREGEEIHKVFEFDDFKGAIDFVNEVARLADRYDHHPDIDIRWNKVRLVAVHALRRRPDPVGLRSRQRHRADDRVDA